MIVSGSALNASPARTSRAACGVLTATNFFSVKILALLRKPTGQDVTDPNIFIEGFPPESSTLHTQSDLLQLLGSRSRQSWKF